MWRVMKRRHKHLRLKLRLTQHSLNSFPARLLLCSLNFMEAYGKLVIINVKCLSGNLNGLFGSLLKWNFLINHRLFVIWFFFFPFTNTSLMLTSSSVQNFFLTPTLRFERNIRPWRRTTFSLLNEMMHWSNSI